MKKKTLLSLLTGIAIVASTAGTYAAWDKISADTNNADVTFNNPVTVDYSGTLAFSETDNLATSNDSVNPSANAQQVKFTVSNPNGKADTLQIIPTINYKNSSDGSITTNLADKFNIDIEETAKPSQITTKTASTTDANGILTESIANTTTTGDSGSTSTTITPTYNVTITPKDTSLAGKALTVKLTAKLSKSAS